MGRVNGERPPRSRATAWLAFVGLLAAIAYAGRLGEGKPDKDILYTYQVFVGSAIQYGLMLAIVLWIGKGLPKRELLGLRRPVTSWPRTIGLTVATLFAIFVVSALLDPLLDAGEEQGLTPDAWDPDRAAQYAASFVAVAVFAPIAEELTYRGEGFFLLGRYGPWVAIVGTSLAFGLGHGLILGLPILVIFGLGLAWLRAETKSVYPGIVLHAVFNALALIAAVTIET
jgi:membrane protease YdiL (CAAX protease family)